MSEKKYYKLLEENHSKLWANVDREYKFDFWREDIYKLPLEYHNIFRMKNGEFADYTGTNSQPIVSYKLKKIISQFVPRNEIEWIHIIVENKDGTQYDAYMPRFIPIPNMFDVLNEELSVVTEHGDIMMPYLSKKKTKNKHFIRLLENPLMNYVSEDLKKAMLEAKVTGVKFKKIKMEA